MVQEVQEIQGVTDRQMAALKSLIFRSQDTTDWARRILAFLLDRSECLTREVCVSLIAGKNGFTADEIQNGMEGADAMNSSACNTHLHEIMKVTGTEFMFSLHYGHMNDEGKLETAGQSPGQAGHPDDAPLRYTFWLARDSRVCSQGVLRIRVIVDELKVVNISVDSLFNRLYH